MPVAYAVAVTACLIATVAVYWRVIRHRRLLRYFDAESLRLMPKLGIRVDWRYLPQEPPTAWNFDPRCLRLRRGVIISRNNDWPGGGDCLRTEGHGAAPLDHLRRDRCGSHAPQALGPRWHPPRAPRSFP